MIVSMPLKQKVGSETLPYYFFKVFESFLSDVQQNIDFAKISTKMCYVTVFHLTSL